MKSAYALEWLDILISATLNVNKSEGLNLTPDEVNTLEQKALKEKEEIRMMLMNQIFAASEERILEVLIQQYQSSLVRLLNQLESNRQCLPFSPHLKSLTDLLSNILGDLLTFIEIHFTKYYNLDQVVPNHYLTIIKKGWKERLSKTDDVLKEANGSLRLIIIKVLNSFLNAEKLTYRHIIYAKDLFTEALKIPESISNHDCLFTPFEDALIYLNFNDAFFVAHLINHIADKIHLQEDKSIKSELLNYYKQRIEQLPLKPSAKYNTDLPSVTTALFRWIDFQSDKQTTKQEKNSNHSMEKQSENNNKINLSVSVAMLGLFVRLLTEEEIITTNNQAELIRFFASHFATPKQDNISSESLYGSYFKPQPGTIRMMTDCLSRIQHVLNKNF